jgi:hypothetical protein
MESLSVNSLITSDGEHGLFAYSHGLRGHASLKQLIGLIYDLRINGGVPFLANRPQTSCSVCASGTWATH